VDCRSDCSVKLLIVVVIYSVSINRVLCIVVWKAKGSPTSYLSQWHTKRAGIR